MIEATSVYGNKTMVAKDKLELRASAYGIIKHEGKILLVKLKSSKKWFFPGGGIEQGELIEDAIIREVKEETGTDVKVEEFIAHKETFFHFDHYDKTFQNYAFFYTCKPLTFDLSDEYKIPQEEDERAEWIDLSTLKKEDFQYPANEIFELL
jgi:8-oxo-dGTP diphosphatase